jgi:hypothetical protein
MSVTLHRSPGIPRLPKARHTRGGSYGTVATYPGALFFNNAQAGNVVTTGLLSPDLIFIPGQDNADLTAAVDSLTAEIAQLRSAVQILSEKLASIDDAAGSNSRRRKVSKMTDDAARSKIKDFFEARHGETLYPSDVADDIGLDYERAVRLIHELEENGQVTRT